MDPRARKLVDLRRRRSIAALLNWVDREVASSLDEVTRTELRRRIMAAVDDLSDLAVDLLRAYSDDRITVNLAFLEHLDSSVKRRDGS